MTDIDEFLLNKLDKLDTKLDDIKNNQIETKTALESHEQRDEEIHADVKAMGFQLDTQTKLLGEYNQSLREHMRRTEMLEAKVDPIHREWADRQVVEKHKMKTWKKTVAAIGVIATLIGIVAGIIQLIELL